MAQQVRRRKQTDVSYNSGNKESELLGRGYIYREIYLRLTGAVTLTTGNNTYAKTEIGDEWAVIKKIEIIANSTDTIKSISGPMLRWLNFFWFGRFPRVSPAIGAGGANPAFDSTLILPFWMPRSVRPIDTALDSRQLSDLKIEITWGTHTDINADASGFTTAPNLRVDSLESFGIEGQFANWKIYEVEKTITASTSQFQVQLSVGGAFRGFLMRTTDAGVVQGDIMNNFKWKSGTNVFADVNDEMMKQVLALQRDLTHSYSGVAYDDLAQSDDDVYAGHYHYDHVTDGFLSEAIDTAGFSEHELELDVTVGGGTTKILIVPSVVIPIRKAA